MATEMLDVELNFACALHCIDMEECACICRDFAYLFHGLQYAGFIIGQHHADEPCVGLDCAHDVFRMNEPAGMRPHKCDFNAVLGLSLIHISEPTRQAEI